MTRTTRFALGVFCLAGAAVCALFFETPAKVSKDIDRHHTATSVFRSLAYGAFRPVYRQYLWAEADRRLGERRYWDAVATLEQLCDEERDQPLVWGLHAHTLIYNLALLEADDRERWRFLRRGLDILVEGMAAHAGSFSLREDLFLVLFNKVASDPYLRDRYRREFHIEPLEAAMTTAIQATRDFPELGLSWLYYYRAAEAVVLRLFYEREFVGALGVLHELKDLAADLEKKAILQPETLRDSRAVVLSRFAETLKELPELRLETIQDQPLPGAAQTLVETLAAWLSRDDLLDLGADGSSFDARLIAFIHLYFINLCQDLVIAKKPESALQLLVPLRTIAAFAEGRIGPGKPYYSLAYVERLEKFLVTEEALEQAARGNDSPPTELLDRWRRGLAELDQILVDRIGGIRSDGFSERLKAARPYGTTK